MAEKESYSKTYGKRPLWQWVVIYLVIGAVVYGVIYYFFIAKKGGYMDSSYYPSVSNAPVYNAPGY